MSICNECWGKGWIEKQGVQFDCRKCKGTGVIENVSQTNEEWLRQCNTEELVKMILDLCDYRPCFACGIGYCDDENWCHVYSDEAKEFVTDWLKQPHHKGVTK